MSGIAVASDLHLGDPNSYLAKPEGIRAFVEAIGEVEQIILLGDVLDLSIASFGEAWKAAKPFFDALHNCTKRILYVPGNHDFSLWQYLEHDVMVTQRIRNGLSPEPFRYSVPAIVKCQAEGVNLKLKALPTIVWVMQGRGPARRSET